MPSRLDYREASGSIPKGEKPAVPLGLFKSQMSLLHPASGSFYHTPADRWNIPALFGGSKPKPQTC